MGTVVAILRLLSTSSVVVAHGLSCSMACGIFPDQGLNPCLLHWQGNSLPLSPQGSPSCVNFCYLFGYIYIYMASLGAQTVKHLPAMRETWVRFLGGEDPLDKEMAIHSRTLAWKIPWTEEPDRLQSIYLSVFIFFFIIVFQG